MRNILVTGGAGFIGSNFVRMMLQISGMRIINIDALTCGNLENLRDVEDNRDTSLLRLIFETGMP